MRKALDLLSSTKMLGSDQAHSRSQSELLGWDTLRQTLIV